MQWTRIVVLVLEGHVVVGLGDVLLEDGLELLPGVEHVDPSAPVHRGGLQDPHVRAHKVAHRHHYLGRTLLLKQIPMRILLVYELLDLPEGEEFIIFGRKGAVGLAFVDLDDLVAEVVEEVEALLELPEGSVQVRVLALRDGQHVGDGQVLKNVHPLVVEVSVHVLEEFIFAGDFVLEFEVVEELFGFGGVELAEVGLDGGGTPLEVDGSVDDIHRLRPPVPKHHGPLHQLRVVPLQHLELEVFSQEVPGRVHLREPAVQELVRVGEGRDRREVVRLRLRRALLQRFLKRAKLVVRLLGFGSEVLFLLGALT
mmetsp:Transcript_13008/g.12868  ORF Transcript_13008/g.12868 Transcript_13008/m.12868 type:complete len:312 (+) Transcript_13008:1152-2087(+)